MNLWYLYIAAGAFGASSTAGASLATMPAVYRPRNAGPMNAAMWVSMVAVFVLPVFAFSKAGWVHAVGAFLCSLIVGSSFGLSVGKSGFAPAAILLLALVGIGFSVALVM